MPCKLTKPLDVYSNFIEQTSNRNHAFVVMPQHINNSLEFEALKTNKSRKKRHKGKKKRTGKDTDRVEIPSGKNTFDLASAQIQRQIIRKTAYVLTKEVVGNLFGRNNVMGSKYQVTGGRRYNNRVAGPPHSDVHLSR